MKNDEYQGFRHGVKTVTCGRATTLGELVAAELAAAAPTASASSPLDLIELGAVYVNEERSLNPARPLHPGDGVRIHTAPRRFACPADLARRILTETEDLLLVEKPAGLPSEPTVDNVNENLLSFLNDLRGQNFFLTHRLAPESEGLVLIAKNPDAATRITQAFAAGKIRRQYAAYVERPPRAVSSRLFTILALEELRSETNLVSEGRQAWRIDGAPIGSFCRLQIEFTMARPKEVRAELARLGAPLLGDRAHGSRVQLVDSSTGKAGIAFRALNLSVEEPHSGTRPVE